MPSKIRLKRISDRIRDELAALLVTEVQDPRLSGVSVTDVRVDRELAYADVYVSAIEGKERSKEVIAGMRSATGFLRRVLSDRVELRAFPQLRFHWDPTPERADQIERTLAALREEENARQANEPVVAEGDELESLDQMDEVDDLEELDDLEAVDGYDDEEDDFEEVENEDEDADGR